MAKGDFRKLRNAYSNSLGGIFDFTRTHPPIEERIARLETISANR